MKLKTFALGLIFSIALAPAALAAKPKSPYERFVGKNVKVYVAPVQDATADKAVDAANLRAQIEEAFKSRKSLSFTVVPTPEESQITVQTEITEFMWTDHDPVDMLMGIGGAALDTAVVEDYARLQANVVVSDTATKKEYWKERVMSTVTKKPMSKTESIPLVSEGFAKTFLREAFSRPKR